MATRFWDMNIGVASPFPTLRGPVVGRGGCRRGRGIRPGSDRLALRQTTPGDTSKSPRRFADRMPRPHGRRGRLTLGLYNSYDRTRFAEAHRRALARAGTVAAAFDCNLVVFGFPFDRLRLESGDDETDLKDPRAVARLVAASTTIGEGGRYFVDLAEAGRFHLEDIPGKGFPPQYGTPVLSTRRVPTDESETSLGLARRLHHGESLLLVIGLGPHGFPKSLEKVVPARWDLTGQGMSLETCTALSAGPAILHTHLEHLATDDTAHHGRHVRH